MTLCAVRTRRIAFAFVAFAAFASAAAPAQDYPNRPLRFIVAFSAGGAADLLARTLGQKLAERWGQQVVIDNRAGAGGVIGMQIAARAPADGYTLLMGSSSNMAIGPALYADLQYDPVNSYAPVTEAAVVPIIMVVHSSVPVKNIAELIQHAKARPGQLSYASSGAGATPHISGELFRRMAGIELVHVPYKGGGEAVAAVLGGQVQMSFGAVSTALPHMKTGRLRGLGVTTLKRLSAAPDIPTIAEAGLPGYEVTQWFGVFMPAGTNAAIVARLNRELTTILALQETKDRYSVQGVEPTGSTPEAFAAYVKAEAVKWNRLLKEMNIRGDQVVR
jgi:tripartite-type tricarboxylate transporter receptor subunit TctC